MTAPTREWRAIAQAELEIGRMLGIGGAAWSVGRPSGEGVSAPSTTTTVGLWAGYVAEEDPAALSSAAPGATVGVKRWYAVGAGAAVVVVPPALDTTLAVGDTLTSVADSSLRFSIAAQDTVVGYVRYLLGSL
jgi:hypothetical protein